jgi:TPR repeat protein
MEAAIDLRSANDRLLDSQIVRMEWTPKVENVAHHLAALEAPARQLAPNEIARLLERGGQFLQIGDVSAARLMLRRAADAGSAEGALGLGSTFDPAVLRQIGALGVASDVTQARQWYQKAVDLGSQEAARRIERLPH